MSDPVVVVVKPKRQRKKKEVDPLAPPVEKKPRVRKPKPPAPPVVELTNSVGIAHKAALLARQQRLVEQRRLAQNDARRKLVVSHIEELRWGFDDSASNLGGFSARSAFATELIHHRNGGVLRDLQQTYSRWALSGNYHSYAKMGSNTNPPGLQRELFTIQTLLQLVRDHSLAAARSPSSMALSETTLNETVAMMCGTRLLDAEQDSALRSWTDAKDYTLQRWTEHIFNQPSGSYPQMLANISQMTQVAQENPLHPLLSNSVTEQQQSVCWTRYPPPTKGTSVLRELLYGTGGNVYASPPFDAITEGKPSTPEVAILSQLREAGVLDTGSGEIVWRTPRLQILLVGKVDLPANATEIAALPSMFGATVVVSTNFGGTFDARGRDNISSNSNSSSSSSSISSAPSEYNSIRWRRITLGTLNPFTNDKPAQQLVMRRTFLYALRYTKRIQSFPFLILKRSRRKEAFFEALGTEVLTWWTTISTAAAASPPDLPKLSFHDSNSTVAIGWIQDLYKRSQDDAATIATTPQESRQQPNDLQRVNALYLALEEAQDALGNLLEGFFAEVAEFFKTRTPDTVDSQHRDLFSKLRKLFLKGNDAASTAIAINGYSTEDNRVVREMIPVFGEMCELLWASSHKQLILPPTSDERYFQGESCSLWPLPEWARKGRSLFTPYAVYYQIQHFYIMQIPLEDMRALQRGMVRTYSTQIRNATAAGGVLNRAFPLASDISEHDDLKFQISGDGGGGGGGGADDSNGEDKNANITNAVTNIKTRIEDQVQGRVALIRQVLETINELTPLAKDCRGAWIAPEKVDITKLIESLVSIHYDLWEQTRELMTQNNLLILSYAGNVQELTARQIITFYDYAVVLMGEETSEEEGGEPNDANVAKDDTGKGEEEEESEFIDATGEDDGNGDDGEEDEDDDDDDGIHYDKDYHTLEEHRKVMETWSVPGKESWLEDLTTRFYRGVPNVDELDSAKRRYAKSVMNDDSDPESGIILRSYDPPTDKEKSAAEGGGVSKARYQALWRMMYFQDVLAMVVQQRLMFGIQLLIWSLEGDSSAANAKLKRSLDLGDLSSVREVLLQRMLTAQDWILNNVFYNRRTASKKPSSSSSSSKSKSSSNKDDFIVSDDDDDEEEKNGGGGGNDDDDDDDGEEDDDKRSIIVDQSRVINVEILFRNIETDTIVALENQSLFEELQTPVLERFPPPILNVVVTQGDRSINALTYAASSSPETTPKPATTVVPNRLVPRPKPIVVVRAHASLSDDDEDDDDGMLGAMFPSTPSATKLAHGSPAGVPLNDQERVLTNTASKKQEQDSYLPAVFTGGCLGLATSPSTVFRLMTRDLQAPTVVMRLVDIDSRKDRLTSEDFYEPSTARTPSGKKAVTQKTRGYFPNPSSSRFGAGATGSAHRWLVRALVHPRMQPVCYFSTHLKKWCALLHTQFFHGVHLPSVSIELVANDEVRRQLMHAWWARLASITRRELDSHQVLAPASTNWTQKKDRTWLVECLRAWANARSDVIKDTDDTATSSSSSSSSNGKPTNKAPDGGKDSVSVTATEKVIRAMDMRTANDTVRLVVLHPTLDDSEADKDLDRLRPDNDNNPSYFIQRTTLEDFMHAEQHWKQVRGTDNEHVLCVSTTAANGQIRVWRTRIKDKNKLSASTSPGHGALSLIIHSESFFYNRVHVIQRVLHLAKYLMAPLSAEQTARSVTLSSHGTSNNAWPRFVLDLLLCACDTRLSKVERLQKSSPSSSTAAAAFAELSFESSSSSTKWVHPELVLYHWRMILLHLCTLRQSASPMLEKKQ